MSHGWMQQKLWANLKWTILESVTKRHSLASVSSFVNHHFLERFSCQIMHHMLITWLSFTNAENDAAKRTQIELRRGFLFFVTKCLQWFVCFDGGSVVYTYIESVLHSAAFNLMYTRSTICKCKYDVWLCVLAAGQLCLAGKMKAKVIPVLEAVVNSVASETGLHLWGHTAPEPVQ